MCFKCIKDSHTYVEISFIHEEVVSGALASKASSCIKFIPNPSNPTSKIVPLYPIMGATDKKPHDHILKSQNPN